MQPCHAPTLSVITEQESVACADIAGFAAGPRSKAKEQEDEEEGIVKYPSAGPRSKAQAPRSTAEEEEEGIVQYPSAAGPRSKAKQEEEEEEEGIVKYPSAGPRATAEEEDEEEGVVDYPAVGAGSGRRAAQKDLTGPDGLGDPSDWDPPPREIPHAGPRRGGGTAAAGSVRSVRLIPVARMASHSCQLSVSPPAAFASRCLRCTYIVLLPQSLNAKKDVVHCQALDVVGCTRLGCCRAQAKPYAKTQPAGDRPAPRVSVPPPVSSAGQQPGGSPGGGLSVSPNSRWAPPPGTSPVCVLYPDPCALEYTLLCDPGNARLSSSRSMAHAAVANMKPQSASRKTNTRTIASWVASCMA